MNSKTNDYTPIFTKQLDMNSVEDMANYLAEHPRYWTMNSEVKASSYAQNVKLQNLLLPEDIKEKAYDFLKAECFEFWDQVELMLDDFHANTGYFVGFNGRSAGYMVLYDREWDPNLRELFLTRRSMDSSHNLQDFLKWKPSVLRERVELVLIFDKLCDSIRALFIETVRKCEIRTETRDASSECTVAFLPEQETHNFT